VKWRRRLAWILGLWVAGLVVQGILLTPTLALLRIPLGVLSYLIVPVADLSHYPRLRAENETLRHTVATLTQAMLDAEALQAENARLRALVRLSEEHPTFRTVVARVVARDPTQWNRVLLINKGQREGLTVGTPVVAPDGVVGKIVEVDAATSFVRLITDPDVRLGAVVVRTSDQGIVQGDGLHRLWLFYVRVESAIQPGDDVLTSGQGGLFPQGLRVGRVQSVQTHASGLYREAVLEPSARLGQLAEVTCLLSP